MKGLIVGLMLLLLVMIILALISTGRIVYRRS
jgi:hypothetical protein